jgi:hypothetical protein
VFPFKLFDVSARTSCGSALDIFEHHSFSGTSNDFFCLDEHLLSPLVTELADRDKLEGALGIFNSISNLMRMISPSLVTSTIQYVGFFKVTFVKRAQR